VTQTGAESSNEFQQVIPVDDGPILGADDGPMTIIGFINEQGLGSAAYLEYANRVDVVQVAFKEWLESGRFQAQLRADFEFVVDPGVRSTPTFFINGVGVVGAQPFEIFKQVLEGDLAGEIPIKQPRGNNCSDWELSRMGSSFQISAVNLVGEAHS
jgi:hypothetical protein